MDHDLRLAAHHSAVSLRLDVYAHVLCQTRIPVLRYADHLLERHDRMARTDAVQRYRDDDLYTGQLSDAKRQLRLRLLPDAVCQSGIRQYALRHDLRQ